MDLKERLKYAEMKARYEQTRRPWYKKWWGVILIILASLILIFLVSASFYVINKVKEIKNGSTPVINNAQLQIHLQEINGDGTNYSLGTNNPQVTIVEFGDFSCPHCKEAYPIVKQLAKTYPKRLKIVWRDYLLNEHSIDLAMAARCAGEQGKFWQMHDALFANQSNLASNYDTRPAKLIALGQKIGVNVNQFTTCLTSQKYLKQIKKDYSDANALRIPGTPTWFVNNYMFSGYIPLNKFDTLIQGLLK